jgi:hypothetical protein
MALPLVRQLLEPSLNFVYARCELERYSASPASEIVSVPVSVGSLSSPRREIVLDAWALASDMRDLGRRYQALNSAEELVSWCKYFLKTSATLILLAAQVSILSQSESNGPGSDMK